MKIRKVLFRRFLTQLKYRCDTVNMSYRHIGDPAFFHPTNPFLADLNMLGEEQDAQQSVPLQFPGPPAAQLIQSASGRMKLPEFWAHAPAIWFARAELQFNIFGVSDEQQRFALTANALSYDAIQLVADLVTMPPAVNPYQAIKERLLLAHQLTPVQRAGRVMDEPDLGDRRPSQLLAALLTNCPPGEEQSAFFRSCFIRKLPAEIQMLLDESQVDIKLLAQQADSYWLKRRAAPSMLAAIEPAVETANPFLDQLAAVGADKRPSHQTSAAHQKKKRGGKERDQMKQVCWLHAKYGKDAHNCANANQCQWAGN